MSTVYNPLAASFLTEFSGSSDNSTSGGESAPSHSGLGGLGPINIPGLDSIPGLGGGSATSLLPSLSRVVAIVLGLLLIGGGIIMFRPETIEDVRGAAAAAAA
jgi:hypothetical protein